MGVIPKAHQPDRWRFIVDLSSPRAASVNDGIAPNLCSLSYVSIDVAARKICELGTGAMMAKLDIQSAYRHIPVHPDDRHLLGISLQLDSQDGIISLPAVKLQEVKFTIAEWLTRRACTKRQLLSLIGALHHAISMVKAGRAFLRRLIHLAGTVKQLHYCVRINSEAQADLQWLDAFLESWTGKCIINTLVSRQPAIQLTSDTSGSWGCEAIWRCNWFQWKWSREWEEISIAPKELLPILLASATWGNICRCEIVLFRCDNQSVVSALAKSSSRDKIVMQLLRVLRFVRAISTRFATSDEIILHHRGSRRFCFALNLLINFAWLCRDKMQNGYIIRELFY